MMNYKQLNSTFSTYANERNEMIKGGKELCTEVCRFSIHWDWNTIRLLTFAMYNVFNL